MKSSWLVSTALTLALVGAKPHARPHALAHPNAHPEPIPHPQHRVYERKIQHSPAAGTSEEEEVSSQNGNEGDSGSINFPPNCMKAASGVAIGMQSDGDISVFTQALGKPPCVWGVFRNINEDLASTTKEDVKKANAAGTIFMLSLKTIVSPNQVNLEQVARGIKALADIATYPIWLRLGHEANWYSTHGEYPLDSAGYTQLFRDVAAQVKGEKVKMYWCPNPGGDLEAWYPGVKAVDIAGVDTYQMNSQSKLSDGMSFGFCSKYAAHPLWIGELGLQPGSDGSAQQWAQQATCPQYKQQCDGKGANYLGYSWFEHNNQDGNFAGNLGQVKAAVDSC